MSSKLLFLMSILYIVLAVPAKAQTIKNFSFDLTDPNAYISIYQDNVQYFDNSIQGVGFTALPAEAACVNSSTGYLDAYQPIGYCSSGETSTQIGPGAIEVNVSGTSDQVTITDANIEVSFFQPTFPPTVTKIPAGIEVDLHGGGTGTCSSPEGVFIQMATNSNSYILEVFGPSAQMVEVHCTQGIKRISSGQAFAQQGLTYNYDYPYITHVDAVGVLNVDSPPELMATAIDFVQVAINPQTLNSSRPRVYDAVAAKSASFRVKFHAQNLDKARISDSIRIGISVGGENVETEQLNVKTLSEALGVDSTLTIGPEKFNSFIPSDIGDYKLTLNVDTTNAPDIVIVPNDGLNVSLSVHQVSAPKIGFVIVNGSANCIDGFCEGSPSAENFATLRETNGFLSRAFPVPDLSINYSNAGIINATQYGVPRRPYEADVMLLEWKRHVLGLDRMVGVVSMNYFPYQGRVDKNLIFFTGGTFPGLPKSVLVRENAPEAVPHELTHSYGFFVEDYDSAFQYTCVFPNCEPINGYDAEEKIRYRDPQIRSIMGESVSTLLFPFADLANLNLFWPDKIAYQYLLTKMIASSADPAITVISGILSKDGSFVLGPSSNVSGGTVSESDPAGNLSIATLDSFNSVLASTNFRADFRFFGLGGRDSATGYPEGIDIDSVPVVVALPYSPKADFIEISRNGVTLKRENLNAQILEGLILSIPPEAFVGSSEKNLNFALNIVAKIQLKLNSKLPFEASGLLQDLLEFIRSKTIASVRGGDGTQYLRSSLIDQINAILCDVVPQRNCHK